MDEENISDATRWKAAFAIILCVLGIIGNTMSIFNILVLKHYKKSVLFMYVLQLAIADMLFLLTIPFYVDQSLHNRWGFPDWWCTTLETILYLNYNASILLLMVMGIDRYIAVCRQFSTKLQKLRRPGVACMVICIVWIISILFSIPVIQNTHIIGLKPWCSCSVNFPVENSDVDHCYEFTSSGDYDDEELTSAETPVEQPAVLNYEFGDVEATTSTNNQSTTYVDQIGGFIPPGCSYTGSNIAKWTLFICWNFIILYIIPILVLTVTYGLIIKRIRKRNSANSTTVMELRSEDHASSEVINEMRSKKKLSKVEIRVIKMSVALVFTFVVCWFPFHLFHLMKLRGITVSRPDQGYICTILEDVGNYLAYTHPVINPLLYNLFATDLLKRIGKAKSFFYRGINKRINLRTSMKRVPPPRNEI